MVPTMNTNNAITIAEFGKVQIIKILIAENASKSKTIENADTEIQLYCAAASNLTENTKFCIMNNMFDVLNTQITTNTNKQADRVAWHDPIKQSLTNLFFHVVQNKPPRERVQ